MDVATCHRRRRRPHRLLGNAGEYRVPIDHLPHPTPQHARSHLDNPPELQGFIIGQEDAIALAEGAFGHLLAS